MSAREWLGTIAGFLAGALALVLIGWYVGFAQSQATHSELPSRPFSLGLVGVAIAVFAQYRGLLALLGISPTLASGVAYLRGVYIRQLVPVGNVAGPLVVIYSMRKSTGVSADRGLPAALIFQAVTFLTAAVVGLTGSIILFARGQRGLLPVIAILAVVVAVWVAGTGALVAGLGIERVLAAIGSLLSRTLGRVSTTVAAKTAPESVRAWLAEFDDARRLIRANPGRVAAALAWSALAWVALSATLLSSAGALGVAVPLGVALLTIPVSDFLNVLPVPGGIGGVEAVMAGLLVLYAGVDAPVAAVLAFCVRLWTYWFVLLAGGAATAALSTGLFE